MAGDLVRIDWTDGRFVDPAQLDAFHAQTLPVDPPCGSHDGKVVAVGWRVAWIDEDLAELVWRAWRLGVVTEESCQDALDDGTQALLGFGDPDQLRQFLELAVPLSDVPGGLFDRATGCNLDPDADGMWEYSLFPHLGGRGCELSVSVLFPRSDIAALVASLRR
jgi:hypothetical protein